MIDLKKAIAAGAAAVLIGTGAATVSGSSDATTSSGAATTAQTTTAAQAADATPSVPGGGGPGGGVSAESVTTEAQLVSLIQAAYGEPSLGLHRGHQDVEGTLVEVLGISHDEMHVRMEQQGQNLAAIATDLGIEPQTLVDALTEAQSPAIDGLLEDGTITEEQAGAYRAALEEAYAFRVDWDGEAATPTAGTAA